MLLIYCYNFLNCFHAFVQLFRGLGESREYFLTYCCYCARGGKWSIVLNKSDYLQILWHARCCYFCNSKKILVRFDNNCAFYSEKFEKFELFDRQITLYATWIIQILALGVLVSELNLEIRKFDTFLCSCHLGYSGG